MEKSLELASGATLKVFETLDSTSLEAKRRVGDGERGPLWMLARVQTAGYGRRGSTWLQASGDLAATYLFKPPGDAPVEDLAQLSFAAALSVSDAVLECAPSAPVGLKWPNDILLDGGKAAGLLLELYSTPNREPVIALGVGVNIVSAPSGMPYPTARLGTYADPAPTPEILVARIDAAFARWVALWQANGFQPLREAWLNKAAHLGDEIVVRVGDQHRSGVFEGLDGGGALLLRAQGELIRLAAGEVYFTGR